MDGYFERFGLKAKLTLTLLLSGFALALAAAMNTPARWLCALAMLMSSVGDIFLMHIQAIERRFPHYFIIGAAFFMLAHLLYTACFGLRINAQGAAYLNGGAVIALVIAGICLAYFTGICTNRSQYPLAAVYLAVITLNCMTVFSYAWSFAATEPAALLAAVGAASFLASDLIIGLGMLAEIHRYDHLIWRLYPIGQLLLIIGAGR